MSFFHSFLAIPNPKILPNIGKSYSKSKYLGLREKYANRLPASLECKETYFGYLENSETFLDDSEFFMETSEKFRNLKNFLKISKDF